MIKLGALRAAIGVAFLLLAAGRTWSQHTPTARADGWSGWSCQYTVSNYPVSGGSLSGHTYMVEGSHWRNTTSTSPWEGAAGDVYW